MAIDRNRIVQQAEKLVAQGKADAAIAQYELLVRDNPRDMNTINKIGDLYSRLGRRRDAILQFNKIGEFYAKDGFLLKAIAIYKKIIKLDPSHLESYQRLADLYAQQGLVLEARSQYLAVAEQYMRAGETNKAVGAYQALVKLDPENVKQRGVLADLMAKTGRPAEAAEEYAHIGTELERKGMSQEAHAVYQKAFSIQPGSPTLVGRLAGIQVAAGDIEGGIKIVKEALRKPGNHAELLVLLGDIHLKAGQIREAEATFTRAIELAPGRAALRARLSRVHLARGDAAAAFAAIGPHVASTVAEGRAAEAIGVLEEIIALDAGHMEALGRLAEAYAAAKDEENSIRCRARVLDLCIDRGDLAGGRRIAEALQKLRPGDISLKDKLARLAGAGKAASGSGARSAKHLSPERTSVSEAQTPTAADDSDKAADILPGDVLAASSTLELPEPLRLEPEDEDFITEHMTEAEVFVKYGLADRAVEQLNAITERYPGCVTAHSKLKEIHLEEGNRDGARLQMICLVKGHLAAGNMGQAREALAELRRFDPECQEAGRLADALGTESAAGDAHSAAEMGEDEGIGDEPALDREQIVAAGEAEPMEREERSPRQEEIEEVDSYLNQGLRDEAVAVLRRLADLCGSHPLLVSRMKLAMALQPPPAPALRSQAIPGHTRQAQRASPGELDMEFEISLEGDGEEQVETAAASPSAPSHQARKPDASMTEFVDLASEIDAALMSETEADEALLAGVEATPEGHTLEEIVHAFKKGIEQQVDAEDFDTHYNLGIAYKEMGLIDEAIGEFQFASKDPRLTLDCCSMLGMCFREKRMESLAVKWYRRGLEAAEPNDEERGLGLRYDLAELLAQIGERRQAMDLFTEVFGINSKYRDVAARIKELERNDSR